MAKKEPYKDWIVRYYASHDDIPPGHTDGELTELIRCRDCKFRMATKNRHKNKERIYCRLFFDPIEHHYYRCHDDDFCSRGERSRT